LIGVHASSPMAAIAVRTAESRRAVIEKQARWRRTAAITSWR